jgi:putative acetyltransferase
MSAMSVVIAAETPLQDEIRALIAALNETLLALTPREHCHHMSVEQMADSATTLFVAREDGRAVAIGALRRHGQGMGEVKRMYTLPEARGRGLGRAVLARIEQRAREEGLARLVLETGANFEAALRLYAGAGFAPCGPVAGYPPSPWTAFYEKPLVVEGVS